MQCCGIAHPDCPLVAPDRHAPIRWVRALSILDGRLVYVPAVMVYLYAGWQNPKERIWLPISTGCAGHSSVQQALLSAILEVIERDAISIAWLQKIPLPMIDLDYIAEEFAPYWKRYERSSRELEYFFFDATTDIGIPTIYGVQVSRASDRLRTLVSCSSSTDPAHALVKVLKDMSVAKVAFQDQRPIPENPDDFRDVFEGAAYMARAEHAGAFDFLLTQKHKRPLSDIQSVRNTDSRETLNIRSVTTFQLPVAADSYTVLQLLELLGPSRLQRLGDWQFGMRDEASQDLILQLGNSLHASPSAYEWNQSSCLSS